MVNMEKEEKVIIVVAPVGALTLAEKTPYLPITPEEIAEEVFRAYEAGATVAHIHARDVKTKLATPDLNVYNEIVKRIREKCDILIQIGGGIGAWIENGKIVLPSDEQKLALVNINPKPDMITINPCTFDFELRGVGYATFVNSPEFQRKMIKALIERKIGIEFEIYDVSHLYNVLRRKEEGVLGEDVHFNLDYVMGVAGGMPATPKQLLYVSEEGKRLFPNATWGVLGIGRYEFPMITMGMILGCNCVRVGFEDNIYISKGKLAKSNAELVEKAARIAKELGREIADVDEAREILRLKG